jgi:hypothetical protein
VVLGWISHLQKARFQPKENIPFLQHAPKQPVSRCKKLAKMTTNATTASEMCHFPKKYEGF